MRTLGLIVVAVFGCSRSIDSTASAPANDPPRTAKAAAPGDGSAFHRKHEDRRDPVVADAPPLQLDVVIQGTAVTWHKDAFDKVARYTKGHDGEARDVWSLRDLAHQLVGPTARVTIVSGDGSTRAIDPAAWSDASRTPLLHTTRRGTLKFRWADAAGAWSEAEVKDVTRLELSRS